MEAPRPPFTPVKTDARLARSLKGLRVLITGPAAGVGRELAHLYAAHGAAVALADLTDTSATEAECVALGCPDVFSVPFNAGLEGDGARMAGVVATHWGGCLDILVLNHNLGVFKPMLAQPDLVGVTARCMRVNFMGYVDVQVACMAALAAGARERQGRGGRAVPSSILVMSTLAARVPMLNTHAYAASKAATTAWFNCLRVELRQDAELRTLISVSLVYFSAIKTESFLNALGPADGPNRAAIKLAAEPRDAAWAAVRAGVSGRAHTCFPSNIGALPTLYALWPWLVRRIVQSVVVKQVEAGGLGGRKA